VPTEFATEAARVDLIVGSNNQGQAPYGTVFEDVAGRTPRATVHQLEGQGHLAHLEDPQRLASLMTRLDAAMS
jgi:pimeloyl-ACP methyl ester carboxylesterase